MKNKLFAVISLAGLLCLLAIITHSEPQRRGLLPSTLFTIRPVFNNTAYAVNYSNSLPTTVLFFVNGTHVATETTTANDHQAEYTVDFESYGTNPTIDVQTQ